MRSCQILNSGNGGTSATTASATGTFTDFSRNKIHCRTQALQRLRRRAPILVGAWDRCWTLACRVRQLVPVSPEPRYHLEVGSKQANDSSLMPTPLAVLGHLRNQSQNGNVHQGGERNISKEINLLTVLIAPTTQTSKEWIG